MTPEREASTKRPSYLPLLAVRDVVFFPHMTLPLSVGRDRSVKALDEAMRRDHLVLVARVSAATLDSLATFETSREDLEDDVDHELVNEDLDNSDYEPDDDREHDFPRERQKYILAAKKRKRVKA